MACQPMSPNLWETTMRRVVDHRLLDGFGDDLQPAPVSPRSRAQRLQTRRRVRTRCHLRIERVAGALMRVVSNAGHAAERFQPSGRPRSTVSVDLRRPESAPTHWATCRQARPKRRQFTWFDQCVERSQPLRLRRRVLGVRSDQVESFAIVEQLRTSGQRWGVSSTSGISRSVFSWYPA